jgi:hypothetical protein
VWAITAAFGAYFCMYGFRKPFTAGGFAGGEYWGVDRKTLYVAAQVLGYTLSKFIGISVIAAMPPERRARWILILVGSAQAALLLFGLIPSPWNLIALFLNGLPLGMVFGLVLGFLEGRRTTELLAAGLCASFIVADGATKSAGSYLLEAGVPEGWMPFGAGCLFLPPLLLFVAMLRRIPRPDEGDVAQRAERSPMTRSDRRALVGRFLPGLVLIVAAYLLLTILRSIRADFAPEIWKGLGYRTAPEVFTQSEMVVAAGVMAMSALGIRIEGNRTAFFTSLGTCLGGFGVIGVSLGLLQAGWIGGFPFMVLIGLGLYIPYVIVQTTVFERLIAFTRARGNLGFLLYLADAYGYLGYVGVMLARGVLARQENMLGFFTGFSGWSALVASVCLAGAMGYFARRGGGRGSALEGSG